jgi:hypothetical protein
MANPLRLPSSITLQVIWESPHESHSVRALVLALGIDVGQTSVAAYACTESDSFSVRVTWSLPLASFDLVSLEGHRFFGAQAVPIGYQDHSLIAIAIVVLPAT